MKKNKCKIKLLLQDRSYGLYRTLAVHKVNVNQAEFVFVFLFSFLKERFYTISKGRRETHDRGRGETPNASQVMVLNPKQVQEVAGVAHAHPKQRFHSAGTWRQTRKEGQRASWGCCRDFEIRPPHKGEAVFLCQGSSPPRLLLIISAQYSYWGACSECNHLILHTKNK